MISHERFAVSEEGLKARNADRQPWDLIRELIQNSWDEAPFARECRITAETNEDGTETTVTVEDDGPGFYKIEDAYTLMGPTTKRMHPNKRGRFNRGEKDVVSVAIEARIETKGYTVTFPRDGETKREVAPNSRERGTIIAVVMPWGHREKDEVVTRLMTVRPPIECPTYVNGQRITPKAPRTTHQAKLTTVSQNSLDSPMRESPRNTSIEIIEPHDSVGQARLYEMGLPVQNIDTPWDIDVMQKIPLDEGRDTAKDSYLKAVYAEALNGAHQFMGEKDFGATWVKQAMDQKRTTAEAVRAVFKGRYGGDRGVFASMDNDANNRARAAGYKVVDAQNLSDREQQAFREHVGVREADIEFGTPPPPREDHEADEQSDHGRFARWIRETAAIFNLEATVRFFDEPDNPRTADCQVDTLNPTMRFNQARLGNEFFKPPYGREEHWEILLHEAAHAMTNSPEHGEEWGNATARAGALAVTHRTGEEQQAAA